MEKMKGLAFGMLILAVAFIAFQLTPSFTVIETYPPKIMSFEQTSEPNIDPLQRLPEADDRVNINEATVEELQTLKGIGPALAQRIVDEIEKNGSFEYLEDLMLVKGIGQKTFEQLKPFIRVK